MTLYVLPANSLSLPEKLLTEQLFATTEKAPTLEAASVVLVVGELEANEALIGKSVAVAKLADLITNPQALEQALASAKAYQAPTASAKQADSGVKKVVAVTACPTGVAHTFLSADAIKEFGEKQGWDVRVETRGQVGVGTPITPEEVEAADLVFVAADIEVDLSKFAGKKMYRTSTGLALKKTKEEFDKAWQAAVVYQPTAVVAEKKEEKKGVYRHLMTGVSHMLPITVAGGLLIAISFLFGVNAFQEAGTLPAALMEIGGNAAFKIMLAVFSGYVAYSIADRPGLASGLVTGFLVTTLGAGFLGAIVTGFASGYFTAFLNRSIKLPASLTSLKPVLILPLLSTLVIGLLTIYLIGPYVALVSGHLENFLRGLTGTSSILLGLILGGMMCVDMGGPINKAAYVVSVGLIGSGVYGPMAAVMAGGMVPPLGMAIATWLAPKKFSPAERDSGNVAFVLGLCFISEGAIPFAAADPLRVISTSVLGGAIAGAISLFSMVELRAPHGGLLVAFTVNHVLVYLAAIAIGSAVTGVLYSVLRKKPEA